VQRMLVIWKGKQYESSPGVVLQAGRKTKLAMH
jgi:hypothetical protein